MNDREDSKIYREAEKILRLRHWDEFNEIRKQLLKDYGVDVKVVVPKEQLKPKVHEFVTEYNKRYEFTPSISTITKALKETNRETVRNALAELIDDGILKRREKKTTEAGIGNYDIIKPFVRVSKT